MFELLRSMFAPATLAKSEYGDDSLDDVAFEGTGLLDDIKAMGPNLRENLFTLIEKALAKGEPIDDRTMLVSFCRSQKIGVVF